MTWNSCNFQRSSLTFHFVHWVFVSKNLLRPHFLTLSDQWAYLSFHRIPTVLEKQKVYSWHSEPKSMRASTQQPHLDLHYFTALVNAAFHNTSSSPDSEPPQIVGHIISIVIVYSSKTFKHIAVCSVQIMNLKNLEANKINRIWHYKHSRL